MYKRLGGESDGGGVDVMLVTACVGTSTVAFTTRVKIVSFYVIVDGLSATLEDSTLQEKPLFNDRSSVPSLSKLVTARTLQSSSLHWPLHAAGRGSHTSPRTPSSPLHPSRPLSGGVACRTQRLSGVASSHAGGQPSCSRMPHSRADGTILLAPTSKQAFSVQSCLDSSLPPPPRIRDATSHGHHLCTQPSNGSLARKDTRVPSEEVEVVSVLEMGSQELLQVEQLLGNTQEVVVSLARGGFGDSVTTAHKGTITTGRHMIDGLYIAIPFEREGSMATPLQSEGAMVAQVPSASAMTLRVCWFVPLEHCTPEIYTWCRSQLASLLRRARVICYNGQQLARTLLDHYQLASQSSEWIHWTFLDTLIGSWLLDPDHPPQTFSEALIRAGLGVTRSEAAGSNKRELLLLVPLMNNLHQMLQKEDLWELFLTVEVKLIPILAAMEVFGIQINCQKLFEFADALKTRASKVESEVHKAAGRTFSVNSTAQLRQVLFDELHLEERSGHALNKTQVHRFTSTSEEVLTQLQEFHPLPKLVLEYRQLCKLNAAFIQGTISHVSEGVMRPCWQHTGTATGRITSTNPNIQAFPKDGLDLGIVKEQYIIGKAQEQVTISVREIVQSRTGYTFLAADFRSIELRLIAHLSGDQRLLAMLASDATGVTDVFTHLTSEWLGIPLESAGSSDRERTKRVVYAVIYGVGKERLGSILKTSADHAKALMDSFLAKFPAIKLYMNEVLLHCRKGRQGNVSTISKRKRWFPHISSANPNLRAHSERQAINFPIQGSAADVCKCGMIRVVHMLAERSPRTRLLIQIHDELVFEVPDDEVQAISGMIKGVLENPLLPTAECLKVPLEVRLTAGKNWAAMSEVKGRTP
ncbi:hypothetical protein EMCRGX_G002094 [Ephydatia muelleri]